MVNTRKGTHISKGKMVRYKEQTKRKLHVKEDAPLSTTNKYDVCVRGLPVSNEDIGVPPHVAKWRRFGVEIFSVEKGKEKVIAPQP